MIFLKLKNVLILAFCFIRFFFKGKANKKIDIPKKILIIQMAKLGDMVCTTPMFKAVKTKYPNSKVYVIGNKINQELLRYNADVDNYLIFRNGFFAMVKRLKKEKIDFACVTSPNFIGLAMLYLSGIPLISAPVIKNGYSPYETETYKILRKFIVNKSHRMGSYAPREYLRLLETINIFTNNTKKYLYFSKDANEKILNFFIANNINLATDFIIGISPSAGNKIKLWNRNKFAKLADYIYQKYHAKIIIIGAKSDRKEIEEMLGFLDKNTKVINSAELFNIDELKALISKINLLISVDTGPIYIAEVFGVPTIDITGPIDEKEQPPIGEKHKIVKIDNRKKPELYVMNARVYNKQEARRQVDEITVDMVIEKFEELFRIINK